MCDVCSFSTTSVERGHSKLPLVKTGLTLTQGSLESLMLASTENDILVKLMVDDSSKLTFDVNRRLDFGCILMRE